MKHALLLSFARQLFPYGRLFKIAFYFVIYNVSYFSSLDINTPVQLGGKFGSFYGGSIRNLRQNGVMRDMNDVLNSNGSMEGFPLIDKHCSNSTCFGNASCVAARSGFMCLCPPGFEGPLCQHGMYGEWNQGGALTHEKLQLITVCLNQICPDPCLHVVTIS
jgi:hypothetical protein